MIVPNAVRRLFNESSDTVVKVAERVRSVVLKFCELNGYAFTSRTKELNSLAEKIESGRFASWADLDDLFACTIVIPTLRHEPSVLEFLRHTFYEVAVRGRGLTDKSPEVFRFDATRFIGRLRPPPSLPNPGELYDLSFEIQVRSAFEHAWSAATHELVYKAKSVDWKRMRMAAQLKAAVEQLDTLVLAFEASAEPIVEHRWPDLDQRAMIASRLTHLVHGGVIPNEVEPKDWTRFSENLRNLIKASHQGPKHKLGERIAASIDILIGEFRKMGGKRFPLSLSLLQTSFGVLVTAADLKPPLRGFYPLITDDLLDMYPAVSTFAERFQLATESRDPPVQSTGSAGIDSRVEPLP